MRCKKAKNKARVIYNWVQKSIKCIRLRRNITNLFHKKIAGLKILIRWRSWVIYQNMKKQIKERILIGRWKVALNRRLLDNTSPVGESDKNLMMGASNNMVAVKNALTNLVVRGDQRIVRQLA
jgi:hypothetical protein